MRLRALLTLLLPLILVQAGCSSTAKKDERKLELKLHKVNEAPEGYKEAAEERQRLIESIEKIINAMLGENYSKRNNPLLR